MKIQLTMKGADYVHQAVDDAVAAYIESEQLTGDAANVRAAQLSKQCHKALKRWIKFDEYLRVEFDLDAGTATVQEV